MAFAPKNTDIFQCRALLRLQQDEPQIDILKCCLPMALFAAATMKRTSARPSGWQRAGYVSANRQQSGGE
jgi:hypothetical protein